MAVPRSTISFCVLSAAVGSALESEIRAQKRSTSFIRGVHVHARAFSRASLTSQGKQRRAEICHAKRTEACPGLPLQGMAKQASTTISENAISRERPRPQLQLQHKGKMLQWPLVQVDDLLWGSSTWLLSHESAAHICSWCTGACAMLKPCGVFTRSCLRVPVRALAS